MKEGATNLYRCFDYNGALLYVGVSRSAIERLGQQRFGSQWIRHG
jgi:hypothetical protein